MNAFWVLLPFVMVALMILFAPLWIPWVDRYFDWVSDQIEKREDRR